MIIFNTF